MVVNIFKVYLTELDSVDKNIIDNRVAEKGIECYLSQQLIYLDCSRIVKGMRMMQTVGYPYKREISSYFYALDKFIGSNEYSNPDNDEIYEYHLNKLIELHKANLEYEKENPPIIYDELKHKKGNKRKPKVKEGDMFPEETKKAKLSKAEAKLAAKFATGVSFGSFKINKKK